MGPWSENRTFTMNYFRGYFRGTSADYSPHLGDPWPSNGISRMWFGDTSAA